MTEYITRITLKRDVSLLYMMEDFAGAKIMPVLDKLTGNPGQNLSKQITSNLTCYVAHLRRHNFDGWLSTISGKSGIEVALLNQSDIFEASTPSEKITNTDWRNANVDPVTSKYLPKIWGDKYRISIVNPVFKLNSRLKPHIDNYISFCMEHAPNTHVFQVILTDPKTTIRYHDAPFAYMTWEC